MIIIKNEIYYAVDSNTNILYQFNHIFFQSQQK